MAQWVRNDQAVTANSTTTKESSTGAPIGTYALVNGGSTSNIATIAAAHTPNGHFGNTSSGSRAAIDAAMFGNTTQNAFRSGVAVGIFGVGANNGGAAGVEMANNSARAIAHAGWVLRTVGSGGRAGRVQYETLVAMGSLGAQTAAYGTAATVADASDDTQIPDA
jgi:hypothetical protein